MKPLAYIKIEAAAVTNNALLQQNNIRLCEVFGILTPLLLLQPRVKIGLAEKVLRFLSSQVIHGACCLFGLTYHYNLN